MDRASTATRRGRPSSGGAGLCPVLVAAACACAGCWNDIDLPVNGGTLGGQVLLSGGVRGARVSADQLDLRTGEVRIHVGDAVTDEAGRFAIPTGTENGIVRIRALGGSFEDLATGATIELDDTDEITSLVWYEILDQSETALVSPIGHLIEARTMARLPVLENMTAAFKETTASFHGHFGNVDWGAVIPAPLDRPANSPVEAVRAAFVHAALSVLARDLAAASGAGPQEVNVYRLMLRWAADVRAGTFDGNDGNDRTSGSGLQLGFCPPVDPACVVPDTGCTTGNCRTLCDLYSGTPRALLAGAMLKVIGDSGPGGVNQTGLDVPNTLSIVRAVSDNTDPNLFDPSCLEVLDRLPPSVSFAPPTPAGASHVRGSILIKAVGVDDTDLSPDTWLDGLPDLDGDPRNAVALAEIDTSALGDGPLLVTAHATDLTGNLATIERPFVVDNTPPVLALDATGFLVDGATWWTPSATPMLTGTVTDSALASVKAVFPGGIEVFAAIVGTSWAIALPPGLLEDTGTLVQIVATDLAGNQHVLAQRIRPDVDAPALSLPTAAVHDEAAEVIAFAADHGPLHTHAGALVDLAAVGSCPSITKFSYLLSSAAPEYATETPAPNPLLYRLVTDDPGVGIVPGSTEYRVGRWIGGGTTAWILDWTPAGAGTPIGAGVTRFDIGVFSDVVAGLTTTEGTYEVQFRATDRLARTTTAARCFDLHLRAPPLDFEPQIGTRPTKDHTYSLDSLSLAPGAPYDQLAARLLNPDATGASLIDQDLWNGTTATVFLTVTVTPPTQVMVAQSFAIRNATTNVVPATCAPDCAAAAEVPEYTSPMPAVSVEETNLMYPVKVFELAGDVPLTELPCLAPCPPTGSVFKFAIPARAAGGQPARAFRVMTMIGPVSGLWPRDSVMTAVPPFFDDEITSTDPVTDITTTTRLTGIVDRSVVPARTGCVRTGPLGTCLKEGTKVPYRALRYATLTFASGTKSRYETAATEALTPVQVIADRGRSSQDPNNNWSTSEGVLP